MGTKSQELIKTSEKHVTQFKVYSKNIPEEISTWKDQIEKAQPGPAAKFKLQAEKYVQNLQKDLKGELKEANSTLKTLKSKVKEKMLKDFFKTQKDLAAAKTAQGNLEKSIKTVTGLEKQLKNATFI